MEYFLKEKKIEFHCIHLVWLTLSKWPSRNEKCSHPQSHQKKKLQSPKPLKFKIKSKHSFLAYMHIYNTLKYNFHFFFKRQTLILRKHEKGENRV